MASLLLGCKLPKPHALIPSNCKPSSFSSSVKCCSGNLNQPEPEGTISEALISRNGRAGNADCDSLSSAETVKRCLRCNSLYNPLHNSPTACSFHGHITGDKGLFSLAPPHQGIDGEWTDRSGVIVYKWNEKIDRPNTGSANWKKRWSCCSEYDENAPPCRRGWHVSYDDGFTLH